MLNAYDIDGVLTAGIKPQVPYVVISGRSADGPPYVDERSEGVYLRPDEYPHDAVGTARFKIDMIKSLGVTKFFENNVHEAVLIQINVPSCVVVLTGDIENSSHG